MKYRKRPVVVEARQITNANMADVAEWCNGVLGWEPEDGIEIDTLEGTMRGLRGDWIIKGVNNEFYPIKPDIFDNSYEEVEDWLSPTSDVNSIQIGDKVRYAFPEHGYPRDQEIAQEFLVLNQIYVLKDKEINNWHTNYWLEGIDGAVFNSVMFEDV